MWQLTTRLVFVPHCSLGEKAAAKQGSLWSRARQPHPRHTWFIYSYCNWLVTKNYLSRSTRVCWERKRTKNVEEITSESLTHTRASNVISTTPPPNKWLFAQKARNCQALWSEEKNDNERLFELQLAPLCHRPPRGSWNWFNLRPVSAILISWSRFWNQIVLAEELETIYEIILYQTKKFLNEQFKGYNYCDQKY